MVDPRGTPVQFQLPGMSGVEVRRDLGVPDSPLVFDVYAPPGLAGGRRVPGVVFVHGDGRPERLQGAKDWSQYVTWGRLIGASGLIGVTFNRASTEGMLKIVQAEDEVRRMLQHLHENGSNYGLDPERLAVWVCSAGPATVVPFLLRERPPFVRCLVIYYGLLEIPPMPEVAPEVRRRYSATAALEELEAGTEVPPVLVVRAGRDRPVCNESIDRFTSVALARGVPLELFNHPEGEHAFDVLNEGPRTRAAVARTLEFLHWHLTRPPLVGAL